jgi:hypothetical protein
MAGALLLTQGKSYDNHYLLNLPLDHNFGLYEKLIPNSLMMAPHHASALCAPGNVTKEIHGTSHRDADLPLLQC